MLPEIPPAGGCNHKQSARNLVVCIDGTSNKFGQHNTNVVKLYAKIDLESKDEQQHQRQHAYYSSGIGTGPKKLDVIGQTRRAVSDTFDMAIALNVEEIVKDAYGWLARTYREGDRIYLFGFSRGAYQVRILAAMIYEVGLIRTPTDKQIGAAYDHYEDTRSGKSQERQLAREFKNTFSWSELKVHFIGVWDTVSAVGFVGRDVSVSSSSSAAHACHFRHALALDERRVKFMPEYFREMNSRTEDVESRYIVTSNIDGETVTTATQQRMSGADDIKEVWFAGCHSDVGGRTRPGRIYQAGNVSLLWMRQEAAIRGLMLKPTDIVWIPDDLDFGTKDSMSWLWKIVEAMPIRHQISFTGAGEDALRQHLAKPRRIIPGQKIHASIVYANIYRPQASLGDGLDIPFVHADPDTSIDNRFWETGLFDDTAAQGLVTHLGDEQVASMYLDRLLFMLRFEEGKQCIRSVPNWQDQFKKLAEKSDPEQLVKLIAIVAYYEVSCDSVKDHTCSTMPGTEFDRMEQSIYTILNRHGHRDGPRVVALLRPLTKHQILRKHILTDKVLEELMTLVDKVIGHGDVCFKKDGYFEQLMDGLNCLLLCEDTRGRTIRKLETRLSRMLQINDTHRLTAALRLVITLAQIPGREAKNACSAVKNRLEWLASTKNQGLVSAFAVEILLSLYEPGEKSPLDIRKSRIRANLAKAFICFGHTTNRREKLLGKLFGINETQLDERQKGLIRELKNAVQKRTVQERTAATFTIITLCKTDVIREYLLEIRVLDDLLDQLQYKDTALLAAYALAACLKYPDMEKTIMKDEHFPKSIVGMLRLDCFDDAVGPVEGFQIFGDLMRHHYLREKINNNNEITEILYTKLGTGGRKEARTSLICLDIFRCFDKTGPWTNDLVDRGLRCLREHAWKIQKAGVTILASLAQTEHGVEAIGRRVNEIVEMLLLEGHSQNSSATARAGTGKPFLDRQPTVGDAPPRPPFGMMGPACALRILAQSKELRDKTRETVEYKSLKNLYQSGTLISEADTKAWKVDTPNRTDVTDMLDKMIKAVDEELLEDGLMAIGDDVLPHIKHWGRFLKFVADMPVAVFLTLLSAPLIVIWAILGLLAVPIVIPTLALLKRIQESRVARNVNRLRTPNRSVPNGHGPGDGGSSVSRLIPGFMRTSS